MARVAKPGLLGLAMGSGQIRRWSLVVGRWQNLAAAELVGGNYGTKQESCLNHSSLRHSARANDQRPTTNDGSHIPPSKMCLDKYRSAESGMIVTTRFPAPSLCATCKAANTAAPPLEPERIPSFAASRLTVSNASLSVTIRISSQTDASKFLGMKLAPMPSTLCLPGGP